MKHSRHHVIHRHVIRSLVAVALCAVCALLLGAAGNASAQTRDPVFPLDPVKNSPIWPFASTSPWNTPIGSGAQYVPINLAVPFTAGTPPDTSNWTPMPGISHEYIVLAPTTMPLTDIVYNDAAWTGRNRCLTNTPGGVLVQVPIPADYAVPSSLGDLSNNSAAFLMPDFRTIIQSQPFVLCRPPQTQATSSIVFNYVDVYGDGRWGSHGGSQLSAIGGSIHLGELRPGKPVRHALSIGVDTPVVLHSCATANDCFRWPAYVADAGATDPTRGYGSRNPSAVAGMKMGALLAIPASVDINTLGLKTEPGMMLAWTLQNYGAYIVDSTGGPAFDIDADIGPDGSKEQEFNNDAWSSTSPFSAPGQFSQRVNSNMPWTSDVQALMRALWLVDNNGPDTIGGGGTPRQPLAPPLAKTRVENDSAAIVGNPDAEWKLQLRDIATFSDSTAHMANTATTATFTFTGTALTWIGLKCNTCGTASVSIDGGVPAASVITAGPAVLGSPGLTSEAVYTTPTLAAGSHTIVITVSDGAGDIFIDALDVTP
ncbi:MAG TPA: hypothetical protein VK572_14985 [Burkholderiales bacterium]|nr:hypothetical protein [Burkholderiales bacterium]